MSIAEWPVRLQRNLPVIEGAINGKKVGILLDTGAEVSLITKDAAKRLEIMTTPTRDFIIGVGGDSRIHVARIAELRVGDAVRTNMRVRVAGERPISGVDFVLGDDFFKNIDLEFDYAKGVIRLFQPQDCKTASLGYWDADAFQAPMEDEKKIVLPVRINGREARALLDSGASGSVVSAPFAEKLGITPTSPGVVPSGCSAGFGADIVHSWVASFDTVQVGNELIRHSKLHISAFMADAMGGRNAPPEVLLGTDFLRAHRVYVARSQGKIYFSYAGGLVFPATPGAACEEERGKDPKQALAELDEILAGNPADTKALHSRARLRLANRDADGAMTDLEALLKINPADAVALSQRAVLRAGRKQYDEALADSDAAIANGMRNAQAYLFRASVRRAQGNLEETLREYDEALRLDPTHRGALRARARLNYLVGRYEAADRDYTVLNGVQHTPIDAVWLHMSRARRGLDARVALEQDLALLKDGEWPSPILAFHLGRLERDKVMAAATGAAEKDRKAHECEARYYIAERLLIDGAKTEAIPLLEQAQSDCPRNYIEYDSAILRLKSLR